MVEREWLRLAIGSAAAMLLAMGLGRFSYTAMVPLLIEADWVSSSEAGFVGGVNLAGFLLGALSAEWLRQKLSLRFVVRASIWISALAIGASAIDGGFYWLAFWRGLLGVTVALIMIFGLALTTALTPERYRSLGTAIIFAGVGLGIFISGALVPWFARFGVVAAWMGVAVVGGAALLIALWGWHQPRTFYLSEPTSNGSKVTQPYWAMLLIAHALFSIGLVPHAIYWVDFIARGLGHGIIVGGLYWSGAGMCAVLGPGVAYYLAAARYRLGVSNSIPFTVGGYCGPSFRERYYNFGWVHRNFWRADALRSSLHVPVTGNVECYACYDASDDFGECDWCVSRRLLISRTF